MSDDYEPQGPHLLGYIRMNITTSLHDIPVSNAKSSWHYSQIGRKQSAMNEITWRAHFISCNVHCTCLRHYTNNAIVMMIIPNDTVKMRSSWIKVNAPSFSLTKEIFRLRCIALDITAVVYKGCLACHSRMDTDCNVSSDHLKLSWSLIAWTSFMMGFPS